MQIRILFQDLPSSTHKKVKSKIKSTNVCKRSFIFIEYISIVIFFLCFFFDDIIICNLICINLVSHSLVVRDGSNLSNCAGLASDLRRISVGFASDLRRICAGFVSDLRRICVGFAPDLRRICVGSGGVS